MADEREPPPFGEDENQKDEDDLFAEASEVCLENAFSESFDLGQFDGLQTPDGCVRRTTFCRFVLIWSLDFKQIKDPPLNLLFVVSLEIILLTCAEVI